MADTLVKKTRILDAERIRRMIDRMAHEIAERHKDLSDLAFIGIRTRGVPLATRLSERLGDLIGRPFPVGTLDITLYRDDLSLVAPQPLLKKTEIDFDLNGRAVVLCDDVLYTGRTIRAALDGVIDLGRPRAMRLAVLIDRGHRELPIEANYIGKSVPTAGREVIKVMFSETDGADEVWILEKQALKNRRSPVPATSLQSKDLLGIATLSPDEVTLILDTAESMRPIGDRQIKKVPALRGRMVVNLFFEASTRTRFSFETAQKWLSADSLNFAAKGSSVEKGESLLDTARNLQAMKPDLIVIRHGTPGVPHFLARNLKAGVVNAGDGAHEHPTQALLDALTIRRHFGRIEGLRVVIAGDIAHSRVVRSNIWLLTKMGARVIVCAPPTLLPTRIEEMGVEATTDFDEALGDADVVMMLRMQLERQGSSLYPSSREYFKRYGLTTGRLARARPEAVVMHPGPMNRGVEISSDVADSPRSLILEQVANGVAVRMAVLYLLLTGHAWEGGEG